MQDIETARARFMDLSIPEYSYMLGFLHADGHLAGDPQGRGRLSVELHHRDVEILRQFQAMTPWYSSISDRHRDTNMKVDAHSVVWLVSARQCRARLAAVGMPSGSKSKTVRPPPGVFCAVDYFRGYLDGDGSVGKTANDLPFLSFGTGSEAMAVAIESFLASITGKRKRVCRNRRDGFFNLALFKEDAQLVLGTLYYPNALALVRKQAAVQKALEWQRPETMRKMAPRIEWEDEADTVIRVCSIDEAQRTLERSRSSIANRRFRLAHTDNESSGPYPPVGVDWRNSPTLLAFLGRPVVT